MTNVNNPVRTRRNAPVYGSVGRVLAVALSIVAVILFVIVLVHSGGASALKELAGGGLATALAILSLLFLP